MRFLSVKISSFAIILRSSVVCAQTKVKKAVFIIAGRIPADVIERLDTLSLKLIAQ
jgi:hypothetical protein